MFLTYTTTHGVVPKWLKLFTLKSWLIKVKESKDASHRQEMRPYRRNNFPTHSVPDRLHRWLFSPGRVCEGPGPSFSAVSWGMGKLSLLQFHLLKAGPHSSVTIQAPSSVTWACVHTHTPTGLRTCEFQVQCTGSEASRPACPLSLRPLDLPGGTAAPQGSGVVAALDPARARGML